MNIGIRILSLSVVVLLVCSSGAEAAPAAKAEKTRRGLVTSTICPYSCADAGIPREHCRERRIGTTCQVEDLRQVPGHRSMVRLPRTKALAKNTRSAVSTADSSSSAGGNKAAKRNRRGLVTSGACPYGCREARVPLEHCREWRVGNQCHVEDYTQPAGHRTVVRIPE